MTIGEVYDWLNSCLVMKKIENPEIKYDLRIIGDSIYLYRFKKEIEFKDILSSSDFEYVYLKSEYIKIRVEDSKIYFNIKLTDSLFNDARMKIYIKENFDNFHFFEPTSIQWGWVHNQEISFEELKRFFGDTWKYIDLYPWEAI